MIILDTNVLSELMRASPATAVVSWLDAQPAAAVATTAVTVAELLYGVARLPDGTRKVALDGAVRALLAEGPQDDRDASLEFWDRDGAYRAGVGVWPDGGTGIELQDDAGTLRARLGRGARAVARTHALTATLATFERHYAALAGGRPSAELPEPGLAMAS